MTPTRALNINRRLCAAWMIRERINSGIVPDLSDVSLTEAIEASKAVAAMDPAPDPERPGVKVLTCHVEPTRVHLLWFWAMAQAHEGEAERG